MSNTQVTPQLVLSETFGVVSMEPIEGLKKLCDFTMFFPQFDRELVENEIKREALIEGDLELIDLDESCFNPRNYEGDGYYTGNFDIYV